jgi:hypothetical protein
VFGRNDESSSRAEHFTVGPALYCVRVNFIPLLLVQSKSPNQGLIRLIE